MRGFVITAAALQGQVHGQASGYNKLITLFEKMNGEAKTEHENKSGELDTTTDSCNEAIQEMTDNIADYKKEAAEQQDIKEQEEEGKAGAENDLAEAEKAKEASVNGKAAAENQFQTDNARRTYDLGQLTNAVTGLNSAVKSVGTNEKFTASTKTTLTQKLENLKNKIQSDMMELQGVQDNAPTRHAKMIADFDAETQRLEGEITNLNGAIANHSSKIAEAKLNLATARDNMNKEMSAKTKRSNLCDNQKRTLNEEIEDAAVRINALTKALDILGDGPASKDQGGESSFIQMKTIRKVISAGFLQQKDPKQPLLDLISKWGKKSTASKFLTRLLTQDKKSEAFARIKEEIKVLYETMVGQQKEDAESQNWCQKKEDKITLEIEDLQTALDNLTSDKEAASTQSAHHKSESDKAKAALVQLQETSVADAKQLEQDVKDNTLNLSQLGDDLQACEQAYNTLEATFKGRTDETGTEILQIVEEVIGDYNKAIRVAEDVTRALAAEKKQAEDAFDSQSKVQKGFAKKHLTSHEQFAGTVTQLEDKIRYAARELDMAKETKKKIFENDDGKCHKYNDVYPSRIADRKVEMENLSNAQEALNAYMESLGIRVQ